MANRTRPNQILFFVSDDDQGKDGAAWNKEHGSISPEDGD